MNIRSRILEAALGLLARSGAHELTQPRVARAAGVRQSHLTYYFPTRAELMQAVARHSIEKLVGELTHAREHNPSQVATGIAAQEALDRGLNLYCVPGAGPSAAGLAFTGPHTIATPGGTFVAVAGTNIPSDLSERTPA